MAKVISSLPGSTGTLSRTSQLTNDGESGVSTYVELDDISAVATTGDYNNLINVPINFTPKVHTHNISDISGTKSEFNTSLTDGNFLFEGDITQYTDELAQDAIGSILTDTATINFSYDDTTPTVSANVKLNSIDATHLVDGINITEFTNNANYETTSQLNIRDTNNRNRVNHTGEQPISTVTGLQTNLDLKQDALGFTPENVVNKVTDISTGANNTTYPSSLAVKTYADNLVVGMLNDRGVWDASVNAFPTTGGSGVGGVIRKGDMWYVSVAGTLGAKVVNVGDSFRALVNNPSQVAANWSILEANIGYVPANDSNVVHLTGAETITGVKTFNDISAVTNYRSSTSSVIISDTDGLVFRGVRSGAWSDSVNTRFFQVGNSNDNVVFNTKLGSVANRMLFSSLKTQISSGNFASTIVPLGIFEVTNGTNRFFNVFESGNSVFGGGPDDLTNRLQVIGTVSSGTTALGNTPPTANNQLTRKDYVDTGLALKANSASPALTGTPTAPTATAGANTTQVATTAFVAGGLATKENAFTKNTAFNKNFGTTAGTVVEGGTLGSNAYTSTAYLPLTGGTVTGAFKTSYGTFESSIYLDFLSQNEMSFYINGARRGYYNFKGLVVNGNITASPAVNPNEVVVKSQLDAFVPSGTVNLTGDQTISGQKSFSLTGKIDMQTNNTSPAISVTSLGSNGLTAAQFINNSSSPNSTALELQTSSSGGVGNRALDVFNMSPIGTGIVSNASNGGVSISSESRNGDSYISNITYGGTGRNYVGRNNGIETYSVDKAGKVTAASYTATSLPVFENNAAASSLAVGQFYRTSIGVLMVKF